MWLLNVWASWCVSCRVEHPLLVELAKTNTVPIVGLNYKDKPDEGKAWLAQLGNPYTVAVMDRDGRVGGLHWQIARGGPQGDALIDVNVCRFPFAHNFQICASCDAGRPNGVPAKE